MKTIIYYIYKKELQIYDRKYDMYEINCYISKFFIYI